MTSPTLTFSFRLAALLYLSYSKWKTEFLTLETLSITVFLYLLFFQQWDQFTCCDDAAECLLRKHWGRVLLNSQFFSGFLLVKILHHVLISVWQLQTCFQSCGGAEGTPGGEHTSAFSSLRQACKVISERNRAEAHLPRVYFKKYRYCCFADLFCCWFYVELRHDFVLLTKQLKRCVIRIFKLATKIKFHLIVFFLCVCVFAPIMLHLLVSEIMLPLFSLPTIASRRGKESCSISLSRTLLSVPGSLSTTGPWGLSVRKCIFSCFLWLIPAIFYLRCKGACTTF